MGAREFEEALLKNPIIAAVRDEGALPRALKSRAAAIFLLGGSIMSAPRMVSEIKEAGKLAFLHVELAQGLKPDAAGMEWCARAAGLDGVISTRAPLLKLAREMGLITVERLFLMDSSAMQNGARLLSQNPPDMVELLPGLVYKAIALIKARVGRPVIAGGMITEASEAERCVRAGAAGVSTSCEEIWQ